ncbi:cytochrome P450 [Mucor mucedo]|uniref:cytochrome P450 n=1 Tax=Mucor mucedo TaxID=29922 RepID=UPI00221EE0C7|nr:cytochrome P450 [Mucor mucedo]KAI7873086.1 cytochrome P450 [Mucor mucedo]
MLINLNTRQCSNIKEVVVDHGSSFEILSRFDLLKNMKLEKFKCRHANVKRSNVLDDPYLAHKIFATNGAKTSFRPVNNFGDEHYSFHGKGMIFSQPDGLGPDPRSVVSSIMGPKQIFKYMDSIEREANDLVNRCIDHTEKNGGTHPTQFFALNSINVMVSALFGKRFNSVQDPEFIQLSSVVEESIKFSGLESDLANFLPTFSVYNYLTAAARDGPNAVKYLLESDFDLLEEDLIKFMSDLIVAGMNTVTLTLTWNVAIMCHIIRMSSKKCEEIDHFMKSHGRLPQFKEREELPYCISVIKECMRYKPTTPFGLIHAIRHEHFLVKVDGYTIPEGSSIISNMDSTHKRPEIYPEPAFLG